MHFAHIIQAEQKVGVLLMEIDYRDMGTRIKKARIRKGLSQEKLAESAEVGITHISHIENGKTIPSVMTPDEIREILIPIDAPLLRLDSVQLALNQSRDFTNGKSLLMGPSISKDIKENTDRLVRVYYEKEFIGVGRIQGEYLLADKVFNTRLQHEDF